jgi:hypothetical protein
MGHHLGAVEADQRSRVPLDSSAQVMGTLLVNRAAVATIGVMLVRIPASGRESRHP